MYRIRVFNAWTPPEGAWVWDNYNLIMWTRDQEKAWKGSLKCAKDVASIWLWFHGDAKAHRIVLEPVDQNSPPVLFHGREQT